MKAAYEARDKLLGALQARLGTDGRGLIDAIEDFGWTQLRAAAPLAIELDRWLREELARPGAAEMLDAVGSVGDGLPEPVVKLILERAGVEVRP